MDLNDTLRHQLHHRSIRQFKPQHLSNATKHTASSMYLQLFSVIHIINPEIRAQIAKISTQTYLNGNGELFIFIANLNRDTKKLTDESIFR